MKALSHWLELKGHTPKSPSMIFDEVFSEQVIEHGKIEEGRVIRRFFERTRQALLQDWLVEMGRRLVRHLPIGLLTRLGLAGLRAPRTRGWAGARNAIQEYVDAQRAQQHRALHLAPHGAPPSGKTGSSSA
jgi:heterodisulfide reductase subunit C